MTVRKYYYRDDSESVEGDVGEIMEFVDSLPTRQIEVYGHRWLIGDANHPADLGDQPLESLVLGPEDEIEEGRFEAKWREAEKRAL